MTNRRNKQLIRKVERELLRLRRAQSAFELVTNVVLETLDSIEIELEGKGEGPCVRVKKKQRRRA